MNLPKSIITCIDTLNKKGFDAYLVGGAVRNHFLNLASVDYDITTNALPHEVKNCFNTCLVIDTGIRHGTVTVLIDDTALEITTYRTEKEYINHRHPKSVEFTTSLREDCKRRDFTMNALCYHPKDGLIDFFFGVSDIHNKIIRCIGPPDERFNEDALRILRAIRFSAQLGFSIEPLSNQALYACKDHLNAISSERIQEELFKILLSPRVANVCFEYAEIIEVFLPELHRLHDHPQQKNQTYESLARAPFSLLIRFALLIQHCDEQNLLNTARCIMNRLKFSNHYKTVVLQLLQSLPLHFSAKSEIKFFLQSCKTDFLEVLDFKVAADARFNSKIAEENYAAILQNNECYTLAQMAIRGKDLLNLDIEEREISSVLQKCLHAVITEKIKNEKKELIRFITSNSAL